MEKYLVANYHTHTTRCKHAFGTEREYIEAAIEMGLKKIGFSDHVPCPFKDGFVSGIRMEMEQAREYVETIRSLQKEYADRITIYVGFETEYIPEFYPEQIEMFRKLGCDYMIMGQHFLTTEKIGPYAGSPTTDEEFLRAYVEYVIEGMRTGDFCYLAHPDIINYQGDEAIYEREITRLCKALKILSIPLEINLLGISENKHYPADRFWKIAGEVGNDVIFGIDAHWPKQLYDVESYKKGIALVEKYNLRLLDDIEIYR